LSLRVSGGFLQGRTLASPPGKHCRPLSGKLKKSLFDYLGETVRGAAVLDLFAGVGVFGVEALSRGASRVTFVERDAGLFEGLEANLRSLGISDAARLYCEDVFTYFEMTRPSRPYDLIFLDPPYGRGLAFRAIERLATWPGLGEDTLGIAKVFKKERFAGPSALALADERRVGDDVLYFFEKRT
jgi:16S rRNA (guanine966-N2)-methyltransferase